MASAELIQELIRAHFSGDERRFRNVALQLASREANAGHRLVAGRIRDLLDSDEVPAGAVNDPITRPAPTRHGRDVSGVLEVSHPDETLGAIVLGDRGSQSLGRLLREQYATGKLAQWALSPRRKLLLYGPPGCGKTLTARVLAGELGLPLKRVRVETLFSRYLGETGAILAAVFDEMETEPAVYLFDEFDAIGKQRADDTDVGEARRIVSTFLQLLDADSSNSLVIAATNQKYVLDEALFRRFDDAIPFELPDVKSIHRLLQLRTASYGVSDGDLAALAEVAKGLSFADVARAVNEAAKTMVLEDRTELRVPDIRDGIADVRRSRQTT